MTKQLTIKCFSVFLLFTMCCSIGLTACTSTSSVSEQDNEKRVSLSSEENTNQNVKEESLFVSTPDQCVTDPEAAAVTTDGYWEDYDAATHTKTLPVYDGYLREKTSVTLYYQEDKLYSVKRAFTEDKETIAFLREFSEWRCWQRIKECAQKYPEYQLEGVIHHYNGGWSETYLLLRNPEDGYLYHYATEPLAFRLVDPFQSAKEGETAFAAYFAKKEEMRSRLPVYPWKQTDNTPWINTFQSLCVPTLRAVEKDTDLYWYIGPYYEEVPLYYDNYIEIPLLDEDGNEGECMLCLIYHHNDLLAELVLKKTHLPFDEKSNQLPLTVLFENAAKRNPDGSYVPLKSSRYEDVLLHQGGADVIGVCFAKGEYIPVR